MAKRKKLSLEDKKSITEEIRSGYFGDGKYVIFLRDGQIPVYVVDNVGELPGGEKITINLENTT